MSVTSSIQIFRPDGDVANKSVSLAPQLDTLAGCRIAVLDNGKPNAVFVMTQAAQYLADRTDAVLALVIKKGPGGRSANAAIPCAPDVFAQVVDGADVVITGAADCGSCSAYSVDDTIRLEMAGVPTVIVTTTHFAPVVDRLAANAGMPAIRKLALDHPIGGTDRLTLDQRAHDATDQLVQLFTRSPMTLEVARSDTRPAASVDIEALRALVAVDGADLEVERVDNLGRTVILRLVLPDASCGTCVMPGKVLAGIAFERLVRSVPGLRSVIVLDPRDESINGA